MKLKPGTYLREPCAVTREGGREASVAVRVARDIEHRKLYRLGRRGFLRGRRQHVRSRYGERTDRPTVSETPWTHVHILSGPGSVCWAAPRSGGFKSHWRPDRGCHIQRRDSLPFCQVRSKKKMSFKSKKKRKPQAGSWRLRMMCHCTSDSGAIAQWRGLGKVRSLLYCAAGIGYCP